MMGVTFGESPDKRARAYGTGGGPIFVGGLWLPGHRPRVPMTLTNRDVVANRDSVIRQQRHESAVAQTLRWAHEAAESGDFRDALEWLHLVEVVRGNLPHGWDLTQESWRYLPTQSPPL
jgi:hypothetical protein